MLANIMRQVWPVTAQMTSQKTKFPGSEADQFNGQPTLFARDRQGPNAIGESGLGRAVFGDHRIEGRADPMRGVGYGSPPARQDQKGQALPRGYAVFMTAVLRARSGFQHTRDSGDAEAF